MHSRITHPHLTKVLERQLRNWEISRAQKLRPLRGRRPEIHDFITVTNNVGAGGGEVALMLGDRLGWPVYDRQLIKEMARDDLIREKIYQSMDERQLGWFEHMCRSLMQAEFRKNDYFPRLVRIIYWLACKGPAVFVGRSADLILPKDKGIRVKVYTSFQRRVENFALQTGLSPKEAVREVDRIDKDRAYFIRSHFHIDVNEPSRFNIMINMERFTNEQVARLILSTRVSRLKRVSSLPVHASAPAP